MGPVAVEIDAFFIETGKSLFGKCLDLVVGWNMIINDLQVGFILIYRHVKPLTSTPQL
jgi:hypothetical protein